MITPTTYVAALILLIISLICLASWPNLFKAVRNWRFELFAFDFAIGAVLGALVLAYTAGTLGSDMAFSDRLLIAGRLPQVWAFLSGLVFTLGNMLLLAAISLAGMSFAYPLAGAMALFVTCCFYFKPTSAFEFIVGMVLMLTTFVFVAVSNRLRTPIGKARSTSSRPKTTAAPGATAARAETRAATTAPATTAPLTAQAATSTKTGAASPKRKAKSPKTKKAIWLSLLGGIAIGCSFPIVGSNIGGEFGLGAYATTLLFSLGLLTGTVVLNMYFMKIAVDGGPISFHDYFITKPLQHLVGLIAGAIFICGVLGALLGAYAPGGANPQSLDVILPAGAALLGACWGLMVWKDFRGAASNAKGALAIGLLSLAAGLILIGIGLR